MWRCNLGYRISQHGKHKKPIHHRHYLSTKVYPKDWGNLHELFANLRWPAFNSVRLPMTFLHYPHHSLFVYPSASFTQNCFQKGGPHDLLHLVRDGVFLSEPQCNNLPSLLKIGGGTVGVSERNGARISDEFTGNVMIDQWNWMTEHSRHCHALSISGMWQDQMLMMDLLIIIHTTPRTEPCLRLMLYNNKINNPPKSLLGRIISNLLLVHYLIGCSSQSHSTPWSLKRPRHLAPRLF